MQKLVLYQTFWQQTYYILPTCGTSNKWPTVELSSNKGLNCLHEVNRCSVEEYHLIK